LPHLLIFGEIMHAADLGILQITLFIPLLLSCH